MVRRCLYQFLEKLLTPACGYSNRSYRHTDEPSCTVYDALPLSVHRLRQARRIDWRFPHPPSSLLSSRSSSCYSCTSSASRHTCFVCRCVHLKKLSYCPRCVAEPKEKGHYKAAKMKVTEALQRHFTRLSLRVKQTKDRPKVARKLLSKSGTEPDGVIVRPKNKQHEKRDCDKFEATPEIKEDRSEHTIFDVPAIAGNVEHKFNDGITDGQNSLPVTKKCETCRKRELKEQNAAAQTNRSPDAAERAFSSFPIATEEEVAVCMLSPPQKQDTEPGSNGDEHVVETLEVRNVSNQTAHSDVSNSTVHRDPSKRCPSIITTVETRFHELDINPFTDRNEISHSSALSSQGDSPAMIRPNQRRGLTSSEGSSTEEGVSSGRFFARSSESAGIQMASRKSSRSSGAISRRILSSSDRDKRDRKRSKAMLAFNNSAEILGLNTLASRNEIANSGAPVIANLEGDEPGRRDTLLYRLRNAKSSLTLKRKKSVRQTLRRMKTMASMGVEFPIGSLKDKNLEELARLGGASIMIMPSAYCPGSLSLPTCIAAPTIYLQENGPSVPYLYVQHGNESVVGTIYNHYAKQVLGIVRSRSVISKTTRSIELPPGILQLEGIPRNKNETLYDVGTYFRLLLSELPGGILGSTYLFRVLKQLHDHDFTPETVLKDPGRKEYVWETPPSSGTRVRMITLALVALTSDMQLELICAVFGLLSLTLEESRLREIFHNDHIHPGEPSCTQCQGYPKVEELASAFAPILYDTHGLSDSDIIQGTVNRRNGHAEDVAGMLIRLWRLIVLQLRQWEVI